MRARDPSANHYATITGMSLPYIWELNVAQLRDTCVVLDIDGTVAATNSVQVHPRAFQAVQMLKEHNTVILFSNRRNSKRNLSVAETLDVPYLRTRHRKPFPHVVHSVAAYNPKGLPIVIIGDLFLTDGILAFASQSRYIQVKRITEKNTPLRSRLYFMLDDVLSVTIQPILRRLCAKS